MNATDIARVCHEVNRAYCQKLPADESQPAWDDAPQWQKDSALAGVQAILTDPATTPEQSHEGWLAQKRAGRLDLRSREVRRGQDAPVLRAVRRTAGGAACEGLPVRRRCAHARAVHCASEGQDGAKAKAKAKSRKGSRR